MFYVNISIGFLFPPNVIMLNYLSNAFKSILKKLSACILVMLQCGNVHVHAYVCV